MGQKRGLGSPVFPGQGQKRGQGEGPAACGPLKGCDQLDKTPFVLQHQRVCVHALRHLCPIERTVEVAQGINHDLNIKDPARVRARGGRICAGILQSHGEG
eukprot:scaffold666656_cov47-Prasinocladus_malaysianus.AAC.2